MVGSDAGLAEIVAVLVVFQFTEAFRAATIVCLALWPLPGMELRWVGVAILPISRCALLMEDHADAQWQTNTGTMTMGEGFS